MESTDLALQGAGTSFIAQGLQMIPIVGGIVSGLLSLGVTSSLVSNIIYGLAITQKESLEDMLAIGARYFEFRPGRFPPGVRAATSLGDHFYYMHACIPGIRYDEFLARTLVFLQQHPNEIVVVQLRGDGILGQIEQPSQQDKDRILADEVQRVGGGITVGNSSDMQSMTIDQLREQGRRLIVLDGVDQYSSYDDNAYSTLDGDTIVNALNGMSAEKQRGKAFTLLQCQATATNKGDALRYSIVSSNASTSLLMSSKAVCDMKTHPWLWDNVREKFTEEQLVVLMNDFFDGATADLARELSEERLKK